MSAFGDIYLCSFAANRHVKHVQARAYWVALDRQVAFKDSTSNIFFTTAASIILIHSIYFFPIAFVAIASDVCYHGVGPRLQITFTQCSLV